MADSILGVVNSAAPAADAVRAPSAALGGVGTGLFEPVNVDRMARLGYTPGYRGLIVADIDSDTVPNVLTTEMRTTSSAFEGYWRVWEYGDEQYNVKYVSEAFSKPIARLSLVTWRGVSAILVVGSSGEGRVHDATSLQLIREFKIPLMSESSVGDAHFVEDPASMETILFVRYGPSVARGRVSAFRFDDMSHLWDFQEPYVANLVAANLDDDPGLEIAMTGVHKFWVVDWDTQAIQWETDYDGNPIDLRIGNVDEDPQMEVVVACVWHLAFVADVMERKVDELPNIFNLSGLAVADVDGDAIEEILLGQKQADEIHVIDARDMSLVQTIASSFSGGVGSIGTGDLDNDSTIEVVFGGGAATNAAHYLSVADLNTAQIEWHVIDERTTHDVFMTSDVLGNQENEFIFLGSRSENGRQSGYLRVFDEQFGEIWSRGLVPLGRDDLGSRALVQFNDLPGSPPKIAVGTSKNSDPQIETYMGIDGLPDSLIELNGDYWNRRIEHIERIRFDQNDGYAVSLSNPNQVFVFNDSGNEIWASEPFNADVLGVWSLATPETGFRLLVSDEEGSSIFGQGSSQPITRLVQETSAAILVSDLGRSRGQALFLGNRFGRVDVVRPLSLTAKNEFQLGTEIRSLAFLGDFLNSDFLFGAGGGMVNYLDLDYDELWTVADGSTELFGRALQVSVQSEDTLNLFIGSAYAVYRVELETDLVFRSSMEVSFDIWEEEPKQH